MTMPDNEFLDHEPLKVAEPEDRFEKWKKENPYQPSGACWIRQEPHFPLVPNGIPGQLFDRLAKGLYCTNPVRRQYLADQDAWDDLKAALESWDYSY
jgi:hypothetical protein